MALGPGALSRWFCCPFWTRNLSQPQRVKPTNVVTTRRKERVCMPRAACSSIISAVQSPFIREHYFSCGGMSDGRRGGPVRYRTVVRSGGSGGRRPQVLIAPSKRSTAGDEHANHARCSIAYNWTQSSSGDIFSCTGRENENSSSSSHQHKVFNGLTS